jgi:hypothetical protein
MKCKNKELTGLITKHLSYFSIYIVAVSLLIVVMTGGRL